MAAHKGNRFAEGHGWGRPPKYDTPEKMIEIASKYFEYETNTTGVCKPTITGLVYYLGFESRTAWYEYKKKDDFKYAVTRMETFIESCYEKNLHGFAWAGSCFALKNINAEHWKDEVIQNQNQTVNHVTIVEKQRDDK